MFNSALRKTRSSFAIAIDGQPLKDRLRLGGSTAVLEPGYIGQVGQVVTGHLYVELRHSVAYETGH